MLLAAYVTDSGKQSIPPPSAELAIAISTRPSNRQDCESSVKRGIAHEVPSASGFKFGCSFPSRTSSADGTPRASGFSYEVTAIYQSFLSAVEIIFRLASWWIYIFSAFELPHLAA